jgi:hypothetical protein
MDVHLTFVYTAGNVFHGEYFVRFNESVEALRSIHYQFYFTRIDEVPVLRSKKSSKRVGTSRSPRFLSVNTYPVALL